MTTDERLESWLASGLITSAQYDAISAVVLKGRFSLFVELNALLYLGVLACIAGLGLTIQTHFANLGDAAILAALIVLIGVSLYYCFSRALPFSSERVESPSLAFDYVLYFGVLAFGVLLGYVEFRFELLQDRWDHYLLLWSTLYLFLAYRFDNRFVLSLALSTLAGWFGLRFTQFGLLTDASFRVPAILYSAIVAAVGASLSGRGLKRHFLRTYLHVAANVFLVTMVSGVVNSSGPDGLYLLALLAVSSIVVYAGIRHREFAFAAYGTIYGYIGTSVWLLRDVRSGNALFSYLLVSGTLVIVFIAWLGLKSGKKE